MHIFPGWACESLGDIFIIAHRVGVSGYFARLEHAEKARGDYNEPDFAAYLKKNIFEINDGVILAAWCSGIGAVPLGFTTYAPNAIEVSHRVLKHLLDSCWLHRDVPTLMADVCDSVTSRLAGGKYEMLTQTLKTAPKAFLSKGLPGRSSRLQK